MGYEIGEVNSNFDEVLKSAVLEYQINEGISNTAILDKDTQKALNLSLDNFLIKNDRQYQVAARMFD